MAPAPPRDGMARHFGIRIVAEGKDMWLARSTPTSGT